MKKQILILLCIFLLFFSCPVSSTSFGQDSEIESSFNIGTHCLFLSSRGHGSPAIVLDVGVGGTYHDWLTILEELAKKTQVIAYDRAGYGRSERGPYPRDCRRVAEELKKLLDTAKIPGPYIFVGHSLGGLNVQAFALKYPKETAGLVLLDPPPLDWILGDAFPDLMDIFRREVRNLEIAAHSAENSEDLREKSRADYLHTLASEHESLIDRSNQIIKSCQNKSWGNLPLYVIASGTPNHQFGDNAERFQKYWNEHCRKLVSKSSRGRYYFAPHSSHNIPQDDPELIIAVMKKILAEIQKGS